MELPGYYYSLYCFIHLEVDKPIGAGLCVDGRNILTCTHVLNAASNHELQNLQPVSGKLRISFPYNTQLLNRTFTATISAWGWNEAEINASSVLNRKATMIRSDLALLQIDDFDNQRDAIELLALASEDLRFLTGDINGAGFEAWSRKSDDPTTSINTKGQIRGVDVSEGTNILVPELNTRTFFLGEGSSGSPVFAAMEIGDIHVEGVVGYVDFLNRLQNATDARMLPVKTILEKLQSLGIDLGLKVADTDRIRKNYNGRLATQKILARNKRGQEIYCDRKPVIDAIRQHQHEPERYFNTWFISGNDKQLLDCFIDRYRVEFIASAGRDSTLISFKLPTVGDISVFASRLLQSIVRLSGNIYEDLSEENPALMNIKKISDTFLLDNSICYVLDCKIENKDVCPDLRDAYRWFFKEFLAPMFQSVALRKKIHFFVSYYYAEEESPEENKKLLVDYLKDISLPELKDIEKTIVLEWLEEVEQENLFRMRELLKIFPRKEYYSMADVIAYYRQATSKLDKF
jgi:hypothetical protein